jgi:hypothetical protein
MVAAGVHPAPHEGHMAGGSLAAAGRTDAVCETIYQSSRRHIDLSMLLIMQTA